MAYKFVCTKCGFTNYEIVIYQADLGSLDEPIHYCECANCGDGFYMNADVPEEEPFITHESSKSKRKRKPNYVKGCPRCGGLVYRTKWSAVTCDLDGTSVDFCRCEDCKFYFYRRNDSEHRTITYIPKPYFELSFESLDASLAYNQQDKAEAIILCKELAKGPVDINGRSKYGLVISSKKETGISALAAAVARDRVNQGLAVLWSNFFKLTRDVKVSHENLDPDILEERYRIGAAAHKFIVTSEAPFLILENMTTLDKNNEKIAFSGSIAAEIISNRYDSHLLTLITTPLSLEEFNHQFSKHMTSRIFAQYGWIELE